MKIKKIIAALAAAAAAVSMTAVTAFAETVQLDMDYAGTWGAGATISKADLEAIDGDVKITIKVDLVEHTTEKQYLAAPVDFDNKAWPKFLHDAGCTTAGAIAKEDGYLVFNENNKTAEFVVPADYIAGLGDSGIGFQVCDVIVKSAEIEAGSAEGDFTIVKGDDVFKYCDGELDITPEAAAAPAETAAADTAPVSDGGSASPTTGNASSAIMISVISVAGIAAIASKKRK